MRKKFLSLGIIIAMLIMIFPQYSFAASFTIDPELENQIKQIEGLENVTIADLENLEWLNLHRWDETKPSIHSLEGLQHAVNLEYLDVNNHPISNLTPVKDISFKKIALSNTGVSDLSPLQNWTVTDAVYFYFPNNAFTSLKGIDKIALSAETNSIKNIDFSGNKLTNINELSAWKNNTFSYVENIQLNDNQLTDISPLANLNVTEKVYQIDLSNNNIQDITPLEKFVGKGLKYVNVKNNPLNAASLQLLYHLEANGTYVHFGDEWDPSDVDYSKIVKKWEQKDTDYEVTNKTEVPLNHPFKIHFSDDIDLSLVNNENIQVRDSSFNLVDVSYDLVDSKTLAITPKESYTQRSVYSIYFSPTLKSANETVLKESIFYSFKTVDLTPTVTFKDRNLEEEVRYQLQKNDGKRISEADMSDLTYLGIGNDIHDFTGLESAKNLVMFQLYGETSASFAPLQNLPKLKNLILYYQTGTPNGLALLHNLEELKIEESQLTDLTFLQNMSQLKSLDLSWSTIGSLNGIEALTSLEKLNIVSISGNATNDVSIILNLPALKEISIENSLLTTSLKEALEQKGITIHSYN